MSDLIKRYIQNLSMQLKNDATDDKPASVHLRKEVTLDEIDDIIMEVQGESDILLAEAEKAAATLAEEARQKEIRDTIHKLATKRLEFKHRQTFKRQSSFKFRDHEPLLATHDEREEFKERVANPEPPRTKSRDVNRTEMQRPLEYEHEIDF